MSQSLKFKYFFPSSIPFYKVTSFAAYCHSYFPFSLFDAKYGTLAKKSISIILKMQNEVPVIQIRRHNRDYLGIIIHISQ